MPVTFAELILRRAEDNNVALRFEGQQFTWAEVVGEAQVRAAALQSVPTPPDRNQRHVGVLLENVPDYIFWLLAVGLSGDVLVGVNPTRTGAELAKDIAQTDCDLIISEPRYEQALAESELPVASERVYDVESPRYRAWLAAFQNPEPQGLPDPSATMLLVFTSGSTGAPKAVICSQQRLARLAGVLAERVSTRADSVLYLSMPLFHSNSITIVLNPAVVAGATMVMVRRFSASGFVRDIHEHSVTFMNYVGRTINYILATPVDARDAECTLELAYGTEASPRDRKLFADRFGCEIREGYGSSEGVVRINPAPDSPVSALGKPIEGSVVEIRHEGGTVCEPARFDSSGRLLNADEAIGELVAVDRAHLFEGYYKNPEAMAQRIRPGSNDFWSGDLAYRDDAGNVYYAGRTSEWVRIGGENFSTAPVEKILVRHPSIAGVLAYPVPDPETSDQLMCTFQLHEGASLAVADYDSWMKEQSDLGPRWRPRFIRFVAALPQTANGKVNKAPLRKQAWETADVVWWKPPRAMEYSPMTREDRILLRKQLHLHGRDNLAPSPVENSAPSR